MIFQPHISIIYFTCFRYLLSICFIRHPQLILIHLPKTEIRIITTTRWKKKSTTTQFSHLIHERKEDNTSVLQVLVSRMLKLVKCRLDGIAWMRYRIYIFKMKTYLQNSVAQFSFFNLMSSLGEFSKNEEFFILGIFIFYSSY